MHRRARPNTRATAPAVSIPPYVGHLGSRAHHKADRSYMEETRRPGQHRRRMRTVKRRRPRRRPDRGTRPLVHHIRHHVARHVHGRHRPRAAPLLPLGPHRAAHRQGSKAFDDFKIDVRGNGGTRSSRAPARFRADLHRQRPADSRLPQEVVDLSLPDEPARSSGNGPQPGHTTPTPTPP